MRDFRAPVPGAGQRSSPVLIGAVLTVARRSGPVHAKLLLILSASIQRVVYEVVTFRFGMVYATGLLVPVRARPSPTPPSSHLPPSHLHVLLRG